jgi:hypothetical protein
MQSSRYGLGALAALGLLCIATSAMAATLLRRTPGSRLAGPVAVWTDGTTTPVFHPMTEPIATAGLVSVRVSFQLSEIAGPCRIRPALRFSNDAVTWAGDVALDATNLPYTGINQVVYGTGYIDTMSLATPGAWVQFGVQAANASAGAVGLCNATLRIEEKEQ